jgi:orotate phosphoribosyltransferase
LSLEELQDIVVEDLLRTGSLKFGEYRLVSGRLSPYYINLRQLVDGQTLDNLGRLYAREINTLVGVNTFSVLLGLAYAAIPLATSTAMSLWRDYRVLKRCAFDRKEPKDHGDPQDRLLSGGYLTDGDTILLIDDVLTTGDTKVAVKQVLESSGVRLQFRGVVVLFDRSELDEHGKPATESLEKNGLPVFSIFRAPKVMDLLIQRKKVPEEYQPKLRDYFSKYGST